jgi:hypothetical protein
MSAIIFTASKVVNSAGCLAVLLLNTKKSDQTVGRLSMKRRFRWLSAIGDQLSADQYWQAFLLIADS